MTEPQTQPENVSASEILGGATMPSGRTPQRTQTLKAATENVVTIIDLLHLTADIGSDLHLKAGSPPVIRVNGILERIEASDRSPIRISESTLKDYLAGIGLFDEHKAHLDTHGRVDFAYAFKNGATDCRFRVHIEKIEGGLKAVLRVIPNKIRTFDQLNTPTAVREMTKLPNGFVLVVGPTGSGKTTTLAAMIDSINSTADDTHIYTLEAPIEFVHRDKMAIVTQREVPTHCRNFMEGVEDSLRSDPDVILVGEMRDPQTMEAAIQAATTGHLVFATLHTTGAVDTVNRIVNAFPGDKQNDIRVLLADQLRGVVSQVLIPNAERNGRVAAYEVMIGNPAIKAAILDNKTSTIANTIQTTGKLGAITLEASIFEHLLAGRIREEDALGYAKDRVALQAKINEHRQKTAH